MLLYLPCHCVTTGARKQTLYDAPDEKAITSCLAQLFGVDADFRRVRLSKSKTTTLRINGAYSMAFHQPMCFILQSHQLCHPWRLVQDDKTIFGAFPDRRRKSFLVSL